MKEKKVMSLILVITNTTNLKPVSDYKYAVLIGDGTTSGSKMIASGTVKGHKREDGWKQLVQQLLDEHQ